MLAMAQPGLLRVPLRAKKSMPYYNLLDQRNKR